MLRNIRTVVALIAASMAGVSLLAADRATYYVAKPEDGGRDGNSCKRAQDVKTPRASVAAGLECLAPGDTLIVRRGTYAEELSNLIPSGTAAGDTIVKSAPNETVWLAPKNGPTGFVIEFTRGQHHITIDGLKLDGRAERYAVLKIECYSSDKGKTLNDPHHITLRNSEVLGRQDRTENAQTIIFNGEWPGCTGRNAVIDTKVVAGGRTDYDHAFYIQTGFNLFDGVEVSGWVGAAFHMHNGYQDDVTHAGPNIARGNIIRNCYLHDPRPDESRLGGRRKWGIVVSNGMLDTQIYNCVIAGLSVNEGGTTAGIHVFTGDRTFIAHNTIYGNAGRGIEITERTTGTVVQNNIVFGNRTGDIVDNTRGAGTTIDHNVTTDPRVRNASGRVFRLTPSSTAAIGAGASLGDRVPTDKNGVRRAARPTVGAYEFTPEDR